MKFGLIGYPLPHSLSPALFKAAYPDFAYDLIETPDFDEALRRLRAGYDGVNVTAPFKELAFAAADEADTVTGAIGAANILLNKGGKLSAFNSDFWAVLHILRRYVIPRAGTKVLVLGCGGAGKAAAYAASDMRLGVIVANRSVEKAEEFCRRHGGMRAIPLDEAPEAARECVFVVNTLPLPHPVLEPVSASGARFLEAVYHNPPLASMVPANRYCGGGEWLLLQALYGYPVMTGLQPDGEKLRSIVNQL